MSSYRAEVIADGSRKWVWNDLRFETEAEAFAYGNDLFRRWTQVLEMRVCRTDEPVNYRWDGHQAISRLPP